jgi:membrane protease YdiL (CAAX protease family)
MNIIKTKTSTPEVNGDQSIVSSLRQFFKHDPLTSAILVILVFFVSQIGAGLLIAIYPGIKNWTAEQGNSWLQNSVIAQFIYILLAESFAVWLVFWLLRRAKVTRSKIGLVKPVFLDIAWALAGYAVYFVCYFIIVTIAGHFINSTQEQKIGFDGAHGKQLYYVFASLVILPPIAEEIMFRGFLFTSFRQKIRFRYAVILTSLLFGIAHLQFGSGAPLLWVAALDTFTLSCVLCSLREKSGSLWPGIYLHGLKNGIAFLALFHARF